MGQVIGGARGEFAPGVCRARLPVPIGVLLERLGAIERADAVLARYEQDLGDPRRIGEILVAHGVVTAAQVADALSEQCDTAGRGRRWRDDAVSVTVFSVAVLGVAAVALATGGDGSWYGVGALGVLAVKLVASLRYRASSSVAPEGVTVAVVVCFYNEDPEAFRRCLASIAAQTRPPDEVWAIDDGSRDEACLAIARSALDGVRGAIVHRVACNGGKRHAQRYAFERTACDVIVTIDSDTVLDGAALAEGLRPFADRRVNAVTADVRALNRDTNVLTRLIDLRYANAFRFERAAYSTVGSVVCCCGSLSFYRTDLVRSHIDDFVTQRFLGVPVQFGDDRRLTQYALESGRAVLQDTAIGYTLVPERLDHFRRQQLRWNKSFFRESLWTISRARVRTWPFWITFVELVIWLVSAASLVNVVYVRPIHAATPVAWRYAAYAVLLAYARNVRYLTRPGTSPRARIATFALAPLYTALHIVLLTPLRVYALVTMRRNHWGTRATVEVHASPSPHATTSPAHSSSAGSTASVSLADPDASEAVLQPSIASPASRHDGVLRLPDRAGQ